jgi:broad specificity phosphatase PhoE
VRSGREAGVTTFLLIRHAHWQGVGRILAGRTPGIGLSPEGAAEADRLAGALASLPVAAVYTSPLDRARETAEPIAGRLRLEPREAPGLLELDFGRWTGRAISEIEDDPDWHRFNRERATARIPGGETMSEAVARARAALAEIAGGWGDRLVVAVSHGDIIRGVLTEALGLPLDRMFQLQVEPASTSVLMTGSPPVVPVLNWRPTHLGALPLEPG